MPREHMIPIHIANVQAFRNSYEAMRHAYEEAKRDYEMAQLKLYNAYVEFHPEFKKGSLWTPTRSLSPSPNVITFSVTCPLRFNDEGEVTAICVQPDRKDFYATDIKTFWVELKYENGADCMIPMKEEEE